MIFQVQSIWLIGALSSFTFGALLLALRRGYPRWLNRAMLAGGVAHFCLGLSFVLRIRWFFPFELCHIPLGNCMAVLSMGFEYRAISTLLRRRSYLWLEYGPAGLVLAVSLSLTLLWRNLTLCQMLFNLVDLGLIFTIVWVLYGQKAQNRLRADKAAEVAFSLLGFSTAFVVMAFLWRGSFPVEFSFETPVAVYNVVASITASGLVSSVFLLMVSERLSQDLKMQALRDPLTGVFNRRAFEEIAFRERAGAERSGQPFSILLCDIDRFKRINDSHGHLCGDQVLVEVVGRLRACLRDEDFLCRWGGDEFLALLPRADHAQARMVAERMRACMGQVTVQYLGREVSVSISLGTATGQGRQINLVDLVRDADMAMYRAKPEGAELQTSSV